jgi:hypothetical protein
MNDFQTLLVVLGVIAVTAIIVAFVLPQFRKRGVDVKTVLDHAQETMDFAMRVMDTVRPFLPENAGVDTFDSIMAAARTGVGNAEQLYIIGQLEPDKRKEAARQYIRDAVKLMGVEVTPEVDRLIDGAIEAEVLELGHKYEQAVPGQ